MLHSPILVDGKIATKEKELEAVQQAAELRARAALSEVTLPVSPADFETLLGRTITDLSGEAERRVAEHLAAHEMKKTGERWIQEGLGYIRADACPFCDQPLKDVALIGTYSAFFGAAYNDLKDTIAYHRNMLSTLFGERAITDIEKTIAGNEAAAEFWSRYCSVAAPQLSPQGVASSLREVRETAIALCDRKAATPLEIVPIDQRYLNAFAVVKALLASAEEYNDAARAANVTIAAKKASLEGANVDQILRDMQRLRATKTRHS